MNSWQLKVVRARDNQEIVSWSGSLPLIDLVWNGRDASGNETEEGLYWVQVSASRMSGGSVSVSRPLTRLPRIPGPLDAIALLDGDAGNRGLVIDMANWIAARLEIVKNRSGGSFKYYVYVYTPSLQGGRRAHRQFVADLLNWMGSTLQVFYMQGHANPIAQEWGGYRFQAAEGGNSPGGRVINVPSVVGSREYKFVFLHGCLTAAANDWADAFNAEFFLGWRTLIPVPHFVAPGVPDNYSRFVMSIWGDLAPGFTVFQALNFTCGTGGRLTGTPPCSNYRGTYNPNIWLDGDCLPVI